MEAKEIKIEVNFVFSEIKVMVLIKYAQCLSKVLWLGENEERKYGTCKDYK